MPSNVESIRFRDVPTISDDIALWDAAGNLLARNCAYAIPPEGIATSEGLITDPAHQAILLAGYMTELDCPRDDWVVADRIPHRTYKNDDLGFHGNRPYGRSILHFHNTPTGSVEVTFAELPEGDEDALRQMRFSKEYLQSLISAGLTNTRYFSPDAFNRTRVDAGGSVVFRLNADDGTPYFHDFQTVGNSREVRILDIIRKLDFLAEGGAVF